MRQFLRLGREKDVCPGCRKPDQVLIVALNTQFSEAPGACIECIVTMFKKDLAIGAQQILQALFKS